MVTGYGLRSSNRRAPGWLIGFATTLFIADYILAWPQAPVNVPRAIALIICIALSHFLIGYIIHRNPNRGRYATMALLPQMLLLSLLAAEMVTGIWRYGSTTRTAIAASPNFLWLLVGFWAVAFTFFFLGRLIARSKVTW